MRAGIRNCSILALVWSLVAGLACGGGGSDGPAGGGTTFARVEGRVTRVVAPSGARTSTVLAPAEIDGIRVEARTSGRTLASDTTDVAGNFELEFVGPGDIDLVFLTDDFTLELGVVALPGSVVRIAVELRPVQDEVIVVDPDDLAAPLRCETGLLSIIDDDLDLLVDGRGGDCLRAQGNCDVEILARSITLINCAACIRGEGNSRTTAIATAGPFLCEAAGEGIRSAGTSRVEIDSSDDLLVNSGEYGIRAQGNSRVVIASEQTCSIGAFETLRIDGNATIDTAGCDDIRLLGN